MTGKPVLLRPAGAQEVAAGRLRARHGGTPAASSPTGWPAPARPTTPELRRAADLRRERPAAATGPLAEARSRMSLAEQALSRASTSTPTPRAELVALARFIVDRELMTHDRAGRRTDDRRHGHAREALTPRSTTCASSRTRPAGGRASCRPTSRWTPRTCCCGSSSASATAQETEEAARWIRSQQRADGTWANFHGGPGDLSTTVEAWVALRLAGDRPDAPHMAAAPEFIRACGGIEATRVFTRIWLALFGAVVLGRPARAAAGDDLPAALVPAQRLRLGAAGPARPSCR